jgi:hypothetical protein
VRLPLVGKDQLSELIATEVEGQPLVALPGETVAATLSASEILDLHNLLLLW